MEEKKINNSNQVKKNVRKKKLRLKKSIRRTAGALLLTTSIIVAAIPVGNVSAVTADSVYDSDGNQAIPPLLSYNDGSGDHLGIIAANGLGEAYAYYHLSGAATSVKCGTDKVAAYPMKDETVSINGNNYTLIDDSVLDGNLGPNPIFLLAQYNNGSSLSSDYKCLAKYIGDQIPPYSPSEGKIELGKKVIYQVADSSFTEQYIRDDTNKKAYYLIPYTKNIEYNVDASTTDHIDCHAYHIYECNIVDPASSGPSLLTTFRRSAPSNNDASDDGVDGNLSDDNVNQGATDDDLTNNGGLIDFDNTDIPDNQLNNGINNDTSGTDGIDNGTSGNDGTDNGALGTDGTGNGASGNDDNDPVTNTTDSNNSLSNDDRSNNDATNNDATSDEGTSSSDDNNLSGTDSVSKVIYEKHEIEFYGAAPTVKGVLCAGEHIGSYTVAADEVIVKDYYACAEGFQQTIGYIGDNAFEGVKNFSEINLPENMYGIGNSAFKDCETLESVNLGPNIKTMGALAFYNCSNLKSIDFKYLLKIGDGAFANCGKLNNLSIPITMQEIGSGAFYGSGLTDVDFSESKNLTIGDYAFAKTNISTLNLSGATDLQNLGDPVLNVPGTTGVPSYPSDHGSIGTFAGCEQLTTIYMPKKEDGIINNYCKLSSGMFWDCNVETFQLGGIDTENLTTGHKIYFDNEEFGIFDAVTQQLLPVAEFEVVGPKPKGDISVDVANAQSYGFAAAIKNNYPYKFKDGDNKWYYYYQSGGYIMKLGVDDGIIYDAVPYKGTTPDTTLSIPEKIGKIYPVGIADDAFNKNTQNHKLYGYEYKFEKVVLPKTITSVGNKAFYDCDKLEEVYINTKGTDIGDEAFRDCDKLEEVTFCQAEGETGGSSIGNNCFRDDELLVKINFVDDNHNLGYYSAAVFPAGSIGENAFLTEGTGQLVLKGPMEKGYAPYDAAIDKTLSMYNSNTYGKHVLYVTGNPMNLECQFKDKFSDGLGEHPEGVYLLSMPNRNTCVNRYLDDETDNITVSDLITKGETQDLSYIENYIIAYTDNIVVPDGIDYVDCVSRYKEDKTTSSFRTEITGPNSMYHYFQGIPNNDVSTGGLLSPVTVTFDGPQEFPDKMFQNAAELTTVSFNKDVIRLGELPFYRCDSENNDPAHFDMTVNTATFPHKVASPSNIENVYFNAEDETASNPVYSCSKGVIISNTGDEVTLEQIIPSRGKNKSSGGTIFSSGIDPDELQGITKIAPEAARDCDSITSVDLSLASKDLVTIPEKAFYDCDNLGEVILPQSRLQLLDDSFSYITKPLSIEMPSVEYDISDKAFLPANTTEYPYVTVSTYKNSAAADYAGRMPNFAKPKIIDPVEDRVLVEFYCDACDTVMKSFRKSLDYEVVDSDLPVDAPHVHNGYTFIGLVNDLRNGPLDEYTDYKMIWHYEADEPSPTPTPTPTPTGKPTGTPTGTPSSSSSSRGSSSSSSSKSSSSSSKSSSGKSGNSSSASMAFPIYISSQGTQGGMPLAAGGNGDLVSSTVYVDSNPSSGSLQGGASGSNNNSGKTKVYSDADGLSDTGKMSASVNGSSDNFVVKITKTSEADEMGEVALRSAFGDDISAFRYLPMDISLYDSTGTNKINPVPEGVSVSVTIPIPDDLAIYGGNAKVASTKGGVLEKMEPRFTVIDEVPCMTFTCTHFSPYLVYVDTANLTDAGISDASPKTADGIHPKWFLCIGLAAIAIVLFLKRDPEEYLKKISM